MRTAATLPLRKKVLFGLPMVGFYAIKYMKIFHFPKFFNEELGVSMSSLAFWGTAAVCIDAVTDPLVGSWTDNLRSPWGRRRPFLAIVPLLLAATIFFHAPWWSDEGFNYGVWYGIFTILMFTIDDAFQVPFDAMGFEMTENYNELTSIFTWKFAMVNIGIGIGVVLPGQLIGSESVDEASCIPTVHNMTNGSSVSHTVNNESGGTYMLCAGMFSVLFVLTSGLLVATTTERIQEDNELRNSREDTEEEQEKVPLVASMRKCLQNQAFQILLFSDVVESAGSECTFVVLPFVTEYVLRPQCHGYGSASSMASSLAALYMVSRMIAIPCWGFLAQRVEKRTANLIYSFCLFISTGSLAFFTDGQIPLGYVLCVIWGFCWGGHFIIESMMADVIDYDEFITSERREGQFDVFHELIPKFVEVPSRCVPFMVLAAVGFVPKTVAGYTGQQNDDVKLWLTLFFSIIPACFIACGFIVLFFYPINKAKHTQIMKTLTERRQQFIEKGVKFDPRNEVELALHDPVTEQLLVLTHPHAHLLDDKVRSHICDDLDNFAGSELSLVGNGQGMRKKGLIGVIMAEMALYLLAMGMGVWVVILGWADMNSELAAEGETISVSPIGMMITGIAFAASAFNLMRVQPALRIQGGYLDLQGNPVAFQFLVDNIADYSGTAPQPASVNKEACELQ